MKIFKLAALIAGIATGSAAQDRLSIQVGYSPGGGFDHANRFVAEFLPRYLPESTEIIVENVPGAGSLKLARLIAGDSSSSGEVIGSVSSSLALAPVFDPDEPRFDPTSVRFIASLTNAASYCITPRSSGINSMQEFLENDGAIVGATSPASTTYVFPAAIKNALNGRFQIVTGFQGSSEIDLALERGDIHVRCGVGRNSLMSGDMLDRFIIIGEMGIAPRNEFEDIPFVLDMVEDLDVRAALGLVFASTAIHYPLIAPANIDEERLAILRAAYMSVAGDPEFISENDSRNAGISMTSGEVVEGMIQEFLSAPAEVQELARELVQ